MIKMGEKIRNKRKEKQLSQATLGRRAGVSKSTVSQWENGKIKEIEGRHLLKLATALGVKPEWITSNARFAAGIKESIEHYDPHDQPEDEKTLIAEYRKLTKNARIRATHIISALATARTKIK